jgi:acyl-CoA thioesterase FadM
MTRLEIELESRGYELDAESLVPPHVLLRYMEHLRWEYARWRVPEVVALFKAGHTFVMVSQTLHIAGGIGLAVPIRGALWIGRVGRTSMDFHHTFHRIKDGSFVASGCATAVYLGSGGTPTPLPEPLRQEDANPPYPGELDLPEFSDTPPESFRRSYRVRTGDTDLLGHMNHAGYAAIFDDARQSAVARSAYGPEGIGGGRIRFLHIEYVQSALPGDEVTVSTWLDGIDPVTLGFEMARENTLLSRAVARI